MQVASRVHRVAVEDKATKAFRVRKVQVVSRVHRVAVEDKATKATKVLRA